MSPAPWLSRTYIARRWRSLCIMTSLMLCALVQTGRADDADLRKLYESEYPAAVAKLENAYSHVRIVYNTHAYTDKGISLWATHVDYLREGKLVSAQGTALEPARPGWPVGSTQAFGGQREKYFEITKTPDQAKYTLQWFGGRDNFDLQMLANCFPAYVAYSFGGAPIMDVVEKNHAQLVSAKPLKLDGLDTVEVVIQSQRRSDNATVQEDDYFLRSSWALLASTTVATLPGQTSRPIVACMTASYESGSDAPKVKKVEIWHEFPWRSGTARLGLKSYEISSVEFGPIPAEKFTLAAYGVEEPILPTASTRLFWMLVMSATVFLGLGIWLGLEARRRRRSRKTGSRKTGHH
jgi:hypothetical protein